MEVFEFLHPELLNRMGPVRATTTFEFFYSPEVENRPIQIYITQNNMLLQVA